MDCGEAEIHGKKWCLGCPEEGKKLKVLSLDNRDKNGAEIVCVSQQDDTI